MVREVCPHHELIEHRLGVIEEGVKRLDEWRDGMSGWVIKGLLAVIGLLVSTVGTLAVTIWLAWNIPGRLDDLAQKSKQIEQTIQRR